MFTGIISAIGTIASAEQRGDLRLSIACDWPADSFRIGESIACNGACLTVVGTPPSTRHPSPAFAVDLSAETVARTAPGQWQPGRRVNLERALRLGDALDGHIVTGHVDGLARLHSVTPDGDSHILALDAPPALARFIAEKGSITLDGVALTVNKVENSRFWVNIIPHSWQVTTLGERRPGDALNLEIDMMARYVARLIEYKDIA